MGHENSDHLLLPSTSTSLKNLYLTFKLEIECSLLFFGEQIPLQVFQARIACDGGYDITRSEFFRQLSGSYYIQSGESSGQNLLLLRQAP